MAHVLVVGTMLVGVPDEEADWASGCASLEYAAQNLHLVLFLACGCQTTLSGATACQFALDKIKVYFYAGRHSVNHTANACSVALAKSGETEYVAKSVHCVYYLRLVTSTATTASFTTFSAVAATTSAASAASALAVEVFLYFLVCGRAVLHNATLKGQCLARKGMV